MKKNVSTRKRMYSAKGRIWLAQIKARIVALAEELKTSDEEDSYNLIYELRGTLWHQQEEYGLTEGNKEAVR